MRRNIIFVGDSYCSAFGKSKLLHYPDQQQSYNRSWVDIITNHYDLDLYCFGYAGKSWYYSRHMWYMAMDGLPDMLHNTDILVFVHTDAYRYNSVDPDVSTQLTVDDETYSNQNLKTAFKYWNTYLYDGNFQEWAQRAWFRELNERLGPMPNLKILHFFSFPQTLKIIPHDTTGMIFTTPLVHLSLGEITGTDEEISLKGMKYDGRCNHFSKENNQHLANVVIDSVDNYKPGFLPIDHTKFNLPNPNSFKWPSPGYGTH